MQNYFAVIALKGGSIREFDIMQNSGNYADNLNRIKEFEGSTDDYERGLFIDHLFTDEEFEAAQNAGVSKTQLYKQAGNSIVVSVLAGIFNNLLGQIIKLFIRISHQTSV